MDKTTEQAVPREPQEPTVEDILDEMETCRPYTVADFVDVFDTSRWTVRRRLQTLHDDGEIERRKHSEKVVTWWVDREESSV